MMEGSTSTPSNECFDRTKGAGHTNSSLTLNIAPIFWPGGPFWHRHIDHTLDQAKQRLGDEEASGGHTSHLMPPPPPRRRARARGESETRPAGRRGTLPPTSPWAWAGAASPRRSNPPDRASHTAASELSCVRGAWGMRGGAAGPADRRGHPIDRGGEGGVSPNIRSGIQSRHAPAPSTDRSTPPASIPHHHTGAAHAPQREAGSGCGRQSEERPPALWGVSGRSGEGGA